jgi:hypothetical protein
MCTALLPSGVNLIAANEYVTKCDYHVSHNVLKVIFKIYNGKGQFCAKMMTMIEMMKQDPQLQTANAT